MNRDAATKIASGVIATLVVLGSAGMACAQDISGRWRFETASLPSKDCRIAGEIQFSKASAAGAWTCEFTSRETCRRTPRDTFQDVRQSCTATLQTGEITIRSKVERILDAGPPELREELLSSTAYRPDNFTVRTISAREMRGEFFSINRAGVRFWRVEDLVS
jgi:hypothetical protein